MDRPARATPRAKLALAAGLVLLAGTLVWTLARSPMSVAGEDGHPPGNETLAIADEGATTYCQAHERLPRGTTAIRLSLGANTGPRVVAAVLSSGRELTGGERGSGWISRAVTVPVRPLARTLDDVTVCASFRLQDETITVFGNPTPAALAAHDGEEPLPGRIAIEYLRPGSRSWAALALSTARRMGLGRAWPGTWVALLALGLLAAIAVLATTLALRELP